MKLNLCSSKVYKSWVYLFKQDLNVTQRKSSMRKSWWRYQFRNMGRNLTKSFHLFNGSECVYEKNIGPSIGKCPAPAECFFQRHGLPSVGARHNHNVGAALSPSIHGGFNLHHRLFPGQHLPAARVPTRFRRNLWNPIRAIRGRKLKELEGRRKERGVSEWGTWSSRRIPAKPAAMKPLTVLLRFMALP